MQGYENGKRSWVYHLQILDGAKQKSIWLTIGCPASDTETGIAGGALRLNEARGLAIRISDLIKRGGASAEQVKKALAYTCPLHEFEDFISKPFVAPEAEVNFDEIPTFEEIFYQWYKLQIASKRWTHKASIQRLLGTYKTHAQKAFGYMPINQITHRMVFETLQSLFIKQDKTGKDLHTYCDAVFEMALDLQIIENNPCPPKKKFTKPNRKIEHHGTIDASRLPDLYQFITEGNSDATFKAAAVALIV